jgi:hypothetical protein
MVRRRLRIGEHAFLELLPPFGRQAVGQADHVFQRQRLAADRALRLLPIVPDPGGRERQHQRKQHAGDGDQFGNVDWLGRIPTADVKAPTYNAKDYPACQQAENDGHDTQNRKWKLLEKIEERHARRSPLTPLTGHQPARGRSRNDWATNK